MTDATALQPRPPAILVSLCPTTILAFLTLTSLLLVQWYGSIAALGFLAFGGLMVIRRPLTMVEEMRRYWPFLLMAGWCLLTLFWSLYPALTLRYGVQLAATMVIAFAIASRLSPRVFLRVLFASVGLAALLSLAFGQVRGDGMGWLGIFGSKNAFAMPMSVLVLCGFALALDRGQRLVWRALGAGGFALGLFLLLMAQSAGALMATVGGLLFGLPLFLGQRLTATQRVVAALFTAGLGIAAAILLTAISDQLAALMLETTGKDATLTGRTDLWARAFDELARNPLGGLGFQAYWVVGNPGAEAMWAEFGIASKTGFHFHNTFISNAVEIGLIGVAIQAVAIFGTFWLMLVWALREPRAETVFLAMLMVRILILSMVEVVGYMQFDFGTMLLLFAGIYGLRSLQERRSVATRPAARAAA